MTRRERILRNGRDDECFLVTLAVLADVPLGRVRADALRYFGGRYKTWADAVDEPGWPPPWQRLLDRYAPWVPLSRVGTMSLYPRTRLPRSVPRRGRVYVTMYHAPRTVHAVAVVDGLAYDLRFHKQGALPLAKWARECLKEGFHIVHAVPERRARK